MVPDVVADPDSFFRQELSEEGLARPLAVVTALGFVNALAGLPVAHATVQALREEIGAFAAIGYVGVVVVGFVGAYVVWVIYAGAFHLIARFGFDGGGSFRRTLRAAAWGFLPAIVVSVVSGAVAFYVLRGVTVPSDPARIATFAAELQRRPPFLAAGVLGVFFVLWQAFIWTFGVKHAQDLPLRDAAITVAVPVAVAILWRVYNLM